MKYHYNAHSDLNSKLSEYHIRGYRELIPSRPSKTGVTTVYDSFSMLTSRKHILQTLF
jgi:hypothetical protein